MQNSPAARFGYIFGLDGLRLFAVLIVIFRHFHVSDSVPGGFGVSVFFFISGFLISRLLLAEEYRFSRPIAIRSFYIRRFIRLLPPLLLMGAVSVPVLYLLEPESFSVLQIVLSFTYFGNILGIGQLLWGWPVGYEALGPLWSLAVEEHFYLLLPAALLVFRSFRSRVGLVVVAIAAPLVLRIVVFALFDPFLADRINYNFTFTRIDAIAWGVLLTLLLDSRKLRPPTTALAGHFCVIGGSVFMLASMVHWTEAYEVVWKYTFQSVAIGIFIFGTIFAPNYGWLRGVLEFRPVKHLGRISYELYLWHLPVYVLAVALIPVPFWAVTASFVGTALISDIAYRLTTKRLSIVRRRFGGHPTD